jgi:hypothetical protein
MSYNFLVASWGGPGHLGPTLNEARQLRAKGHGVRFIARADAREPVEAAGFGFATWQREPRSRPLPGAAPPLRAHMITSSLVPLPREAQTRWMNSSVLQLTLC